MLLVLPEKCTKLLALENIFFEEEIFTRWTNKKVSADKYLQVISKVYYNLHDELPICDTTIAKIHKELWPNRPSSNTKICGYLLSKYGYKFCVHCSTVQSISNWHTNTSKYGGKDSYCKTCFNDIVRDYRRSYEAERRSNKLNRTPIWSESAEIKAMYESCPEGFQVDHIIPLQGDLVSGLHVLKNLQYLSKEDNLKKSNKYIPE